MRVLCINAGSSSVKVALYEVDEPAAAAAANGASSSNCSSSSSPSPSSGSEPKLIVSRNLPEQETDPVLTIQHFVAQQEKEEQSHVAIGAAVHPHPIRMVVHRIVHGGSLFSAPTVLTPRVVRQLESLNTLAPLHNPPALKWIRACEDAFNSVSNGAGGATAAAGASKSRPGSASSSGPPTLMSPNAAAVSGVAPGPPSAAAPSPLVHSPAAPATPASAPPRTLVRQIGIFDTAYFAALPAESTTYALPSSLLAKHSIRRYGFHGIAHEDMLRVVKQLDTDRPALTAGGRLITMQLGSGSSVAAVLDGHPIDTSMGFTPLEGLVMSSRSGDVDAGVVTFLQTHDESFATPQAVEKMLYNQSGFVGLTDGWTKDMKTIEDRALCADPAALHRASAQRAMDVFMHRLVKYLGAYVALLGGLDSVVFGGGIGEHSTEVRARVLGQLGKYLPVEIDPDANRKCSTKGGKHCLITTPTSKIKVWVVAVDETALMLRDALNITEPTGTQSAL